LYSKGRLEKKVEENFVKSGPANKLTHGLLNKMFIEILWTFCISKQNTLNYILESHTMTREEWMKL
jgi:hypothetical protein